MAFRLLSGSLTPCHIQQFLPQIALTSRKRVLSHPDPTYPPLPQALCIALGWRHPNGEVPPVSAQGYPVPSLYCNPPLPHISSAKRPVEISNKGKCSFPCVWAFGRTDRPNPESPRLAELPCVVIKAWPAGCLGWYTRCHSPVSPESSWLLKPGTSGLARQLSGSWKRGLLLDPT